MPGYCFPSICIASGPCHRVTPATSRGGESLREAFPSRHECYSSGRNGSINPRPSIARVRYGSDVFGNTRFAIRMISTGISTTFLGIRSSIGMYPAPSIGRIRRFVNMSRKAYTWLIGAETELINGFPMHLWIFSTVMVGMSTCPPYWAVILRANAFSDLVGRLRGVIRHDTQAYKSMTSP